MCKCKMKTIERHKINVRFSITKTITPNEMKYDIEHTLCDN